jgi:hypothetical protein
MRNNDVQAAQRLTSKLLQAVSDKAHAPGNRCWLYCSDVTCNNSST